MRDVKLPSGEGPKGGAGVTNTKHFDEVRSSKGKGEVTHPNNRRTMDDAERLPEKVVDHVDGHSRIHVNSSPTGGHDAHGNAMKAHYQAMEAHRNHMENQRGNSPRHSTGLTHGKTDKPNSEYGTPGMPNDETNDMC